ncbi:phosphotransferase family protein [Nocardioides terrisoli]|uniref:phosphotransferase n=1 Tax=Nocardioides terrisoli TaxID=3388267 RepID=UPI00287B939C|nr:phosphotransferase [Nocardioides marmorisolisilvae]
MPQSSDAVSPLPHGHTARRLVWEFLPPPIRAMVEEHLGSPVVRAESRDSGFTPGFASVVTGADGSTQFVKAASRKAQAPFAASYAEEARALLLLGDTIPAPRLLWFHDGDWVVLGFETFAGRQPRRPWVSRELDRALDLAEHIARVLDPVPEQLVLEPLVKGIPELVTGWASVAAQHPDFPHLDELAMLAASFADLSDRAFCHADLRDDNVLLGPHGDAACDWNWPALGPAWLDTVDLLVGARGDGLDVERHLATRPLTRDVDPAHIDGWLAALCGSMMVSRERPVPNSSPYLRAHAAWYADTLWDWLVERRGWQ